MRTRNLLTALAALALSATLVQPAMAATPHKKHGHHHAQMQKSGKSHRHGKKPHARKASTPKAKPATPG